MESEFKVPARGIYDEKSRIERLNFIQNIRKVSLPNIGSSRLNPAGLTKNIEALIGSVEIPLGIAGPLKLNGSLGEDIFYLPMATTEGALIASATRGATALTNSGGVRARTIEQVMYRSPVLCFNSIIEAKKFSEWVSDKVIFCQGIIHNYSKHAKLKSISPTIAGKNVHLEFAYETGNAAGQNMTTTCTWEAVKSINHEYQRITPASEWPQQLLIEGNGSSDKKLSGKTYFRGRGTRVVAEARLTNEECFKSLKLTTKDLFKSYQLVQQGAQLDFMVGFTINIANIIGAVFMATGQDVACVHESSSGLLQMELIDDGSLYVSMTIPSLIVGTIGGGTRLPHQKEALQMLGCEFEQSSAKLAEIIAGFCLALDLSTLAAIATDQFVTAHERLGRNKQMGQLQVENLNLEFIKTRLPAMNVSFIEMLTKSEEGSSIIMEMTSRSVNKMIGLFPIRIGNPGFEQKIMMKIKPLDNEIALAMNSLAANSHPDLARAFSRHKFKIDVEKCHLRELQLAKIENQALRKYSPINFGVSINSSNEEYILFDEYLEDMVLMNSVENISAWNGEIVQAALYGIGQVHAEWYGKTDQIIRMVELKEHTTESFKSQEDLWHALFMNAVTENPEWFDPQMKDAIQSMLTQIHTWYPHIDHSAKTLIHNDFNPRNIAFRKSLELCAYDWELARISIPQYDCVELLAFTSDPNNISKEQILRGIFFHKKVLEQASGKIIDDTDWLNGFKASLNEFILSRLMLYIMAHKFREYKFLERVVRATFGIYKALR